MFSFFGLEQKEAPQVTSSSQGSSQPNHGVGSQAPSPLFGGMDVQSPEGQPESGSGFSFIADPEVPSSAFSFIQPSNDTQPVNQSGFSFLSDEAHASQDPVASSFSFMSNTVAVGRDDILNVEPPVHSYEGQSSFSFMASAVTGGQSEVRNANDTEPVGAGVSTTPQTHAALETESTIRLARSSLNKQTIKKKRAAKVGFGREEDEDEKKLSGLTAGGVESTSQVAQSAPHASCQTSLATAPTGGRGEDEDRRLTVETSPIAVVDPTISSIPLNILAAMASAPQPVAAFSPVESEHASVRAALPPSDTSAVAAEESVSDHIGIPTTPPPPVPQSAREASPGPAAAAPVEGCPHSPYINGSKPAQPQPVKSGQSSAQLSPVETPVQKLERRSREALIQIGRALADLSHLHSAALEGQLRFKQEIEAESARLDAARARKESTEQEQARLAQEEDFESADALNTVLEHVAVDILKSEAELRSLRGSVRMLEETFAQERAEIVDGLARAAASLTATMEQLKLGASQLERAAEKQFAVEQARIAAELERIGLEKSHFDREEQALSEDTSRTEEAIQSQTGDLGERRSALEDCIGSVDSDIRALQEQLAAKIAEKAQLSADLEEVESKIGEVRKKYDRQLQRISDRRSTLLQSKQECLEEESAVLRDQDTLEENTAKEKATASTLRVWTQRLQSDSVILDSLLRNLTSTRASDSKQSSNIAIAAISASGDDEGNTGTESLRKNLDAIVFLTAKKAAIVTEVATRRDVLLAESRRLGESIPLLDAEKKAHAASKRFKEAAAVARDLKDQQVAKEAADAELVSAEADIAHLQAELLELAAQESSTRAALEEAQKLMDAANFERLVERARTVHSLLELSDRQGAASEMHADQVLFTALNSFLSREFESVLHEAKEIQVRHGFPTSVEDILAASRSASGSAGSPVPRDGHVQDENAVAGEAVAPGDGYPEADAPEADPNRDLEGDPDGVGRGNEAVEGATTVQAPDIDTQEQGTPQEDCEPAAPKDEAAEEPEPEQSSSRAEEIVRAKAMVAELSELGAEMDEASDQEDYEKAAELFEAITTCTAQLEQVLEALGCTREELLREQ